MFCKKKKKKKKKKIILNNNAFNVLLFVCIILQFIFINVNFYILVKFIIFYFIKDQLFYSYSFFFFFFFFFK